MTKEEIKSRLKRTATESVFYVAGGTVFVQEVAASRGIPLDQAQKEVAEIAVNLVDNIRNM